MFSLSTAIVVEDAKTKAETQIELFVGLEVQGDVEGAEHEESILQK